MHKLGHSLKSQFPNKDIIHLNTGSFGSVPNRVLANRYNDIESVEKNPDYELKVNVPLRLNNIIKKLCSRLNCSCSNLVLIDNTMYGLNVVFNCLNPSTEDLMILTKVHYEPLMNLVNKYNTNCKIIDIDLYLTNENLVDSMVNQILSWETEKYARTILVVEAISSIPAIVLPIQRLLETFISKKFVTIVDGAHSFNQIDIDLCELDVDFYIGNLYKWAYTFRPTAFLYCKNTDKYELKPLEVTFEYNNKCFRDRFMWTGTMDFTPFLSIAKALEFIDEIGSDNIREYNSNLAYEGGRIVAEKLGDTNFKRIDRTQMAYMVNIRIKDAPDVGLDRLYGLKLAKYLYETNKLVVKVFEWDHYWYVRLSAQIFVELSDFHYASECLYKALKSKLIV